MIPGGHEFFSPALAVWLIFSFGFYFKFKTFHLSVIKHAWPMIAYFVLTVISNYVFFNPDDPFSAIEVKLSFLLLPLAFAFYPYHGTEFKKLLMNAFVSGILFWSIIQLLRSLFLVIIKQNFNFLFYTEFSSFIHPSYYAMYVCTVLLMINFFELIPNQIKNLKTWLNLVFPVFVLISASKMGIICLFLTLCVLIMKALKEKFNTALTLIIFIASAILMMTTIFVIEPIRNRFVFVTDSIEMPLDKTSTESNMVRRLVWIADKEAINKMPWYGYGVANVNKVLSGEYERLGFTGAKSRNLNAHNQYLQTLIGLGWMGLILLLWMHWEMLRAGAETKNYFWITLLIILILNFLVESMLQRASGSIYFSFVYMLFLMIEKVKFQEQINTPI
ncbi:MAG: O-antigen ligase family protein [Bacteroidia bacterium]|nr:O-antigen ligase family protein [Bacteroidia bacterium]